MAWRRRRMHSWVWLMSGCVAACGGSEDGTYMIRGSARLPACVETPAFDLGGTSWIDSGTLMVTTTGCDLEMGTQVGVCGLRWDFAQSGSEVDILVDNEYRIDGRLCGDQLHLEGGWWLPVVNEARGCTYEEEDAAEVGIESEGATLTVSASELSGTLVVREGCTASYAVTFSETS